MNDKDIKIKIQSSIKAFSEGNVSENSLALFSTLGYIIDRQNPFTEKTYKFFKESFLDSNTRFNEDKAIVKDWKSIDLLFQLSQEEVSSQQSLFDTKRVDNTIIETYLFFVIELINNDYSRTALAQITREINKAFPMPAMLIFKHGNKITVSVINRRLHKRDSQKDVLEKVTLIKDISCENPHRAHIEILFDLSFPELLRIHKFSNFVELHNAWQKTLDTKELNKRFYRELSDWYFWAMHEVYFPGASIESDKKTIFQKDEKVREHNAKNLIRLLTRILFVWFIKEKSLIPEELFDEKYIKEKLISGFEPRKKNNFDHKAQGSKYYRAILQNLFFATLNQTVGKREFRKEGQQMNVTNLMRYESYFKDSKAFLKMVEEVVPFMNGGLFECLDSPDPILKGKKGGDVINYEDGFSDRKDNPLCVPDYIFFGIDEHADLSEEYGDKKQKNVSVSGLINILKSYKFTVTENTPIEEDIALDPELLGRVFENLLASYNPETKTTARKQTGSFYTPREIVNYMVDESLKAYLKQKLESEANMEPDDAETGLVYLIGYNEKGYEYFNEKQTSVLINAIDICKILDPACGSGAFPMGILHKLVHILHKLDPNNEKWRNIQRQKAIKETEEAFKIGNKQEREDLLKEISDVFEYNSDDYGRKLYLIENCIYGVDIQPIATQISKLRFFISLIVDQKTDKARDNFGIRPLPNLETKFVAANTLVNIKKPDGFLKNIELDKLENRLDDVRHRLFSAKTPVTKRKLREEDQIIRNEMKKLLENSGWNNESAEQLTTWDPYNQNMTCTFFDPEWMFGNNTGFDIVLGNPPYIDSEMMVNCGQGYLRDYISNNYEYTKGNWDIYIAFFEKAFKLATSSGIISYITPDKWLTKPFGETFRTNKINKLSILLKSGRNVFETVGVDSIVTIFNTESESFKLQDYIDEQIKDNCIIPKDIFTEPYQLDIVFSPFLDLLLNITKRFKPLIASGYSCENACATSDAYELKNIIKDSTVNYDQTKYYKVINTGTIDKYDSRWGIKEMTYLKDKYLFPVVSMKDFHKFFPNTYGEKAKKSKLIVKGLTLLDATLDLYGEFIPGKTTLIITSDKRVSLFYLSLIINSKLAQFYITERYSSASYNGGVNFTKSMINNFPLPSEVKSSLCKFLSISLLLLRHSDNTTLFHFFYSISNSFVYELYFPNEISIINAEIIKHLADLPELKDDWSDDKKLKIIEKFYKEYSNPNHPVSISMEVMKTIPQIRIIEGLDK